MRVAHEAVRPGLGLDPDDDIPGLHIMYRPRPFNLADAKEAAWLSELMTELDAAVAFVDVFRRAAQINENSAEDFNKVREALEDERPTLSHDRVMKEARASIERKRRARS